MQPDDWTLALAREREMYARSTRPDKVIPVDVELAARGWVMDTDGHLVDLAKHQAAAEAKKAQRPPRERAVAPKAPETAVAD